MIILNLMNYTESGLSNIAPIPIIGRAAGVVRVAVGLVHTITALAFTILMTPPALFIKEFRPTWTDCSVHIGRGLYDVLAGTLEAVPIIGVIF